MITKDEIARIIEHTIRSNDAILDANLLLLRTVNTALMVHYFGARMLGTCSQCGQQKQVFLAVDPFQLEVHGERSEPMLWCQDCHDNSRKDT